MAATDEATERKVCISIRMPESLHEAVKRKAREEERSMEAWIRYALKEKVNEWPE